MWHCRQGVHDFLRAYFHHKSADWKDNRPHRLAAWSAEELAKMPTYYIMDLADDMPAAVAKEMPSPQEIAACRWLPDAELAVYAAEYQRTGFQGGLNWYRSRSGGAFESELQLFSGRTIDVPSIFISGQSDWGVYQRPGRVRAHAGHGVHPFRRLSPARRRRALGAAGAGGPGQRAAPGLPEGARGVETPRRAQGCEVDRRTSPGVRASVRLNAFANAASDV